MKTAKSIAEKYVYGKHDALTDEQEVIDMSNDIEQFANQSLWVFTEPKTEGTYLIAYRFGVCEGKFRNGRYLTSDFQHELPEAYAHMLMPDKPQPPTE